ncbi:MAG TPA: pyridoxamine 5'-phosphate oxidase family protein [Burkholderiaceae bacterium]
MDDQHLITDLAALEALFGPVGEASRRKQVATIPPVYRAVIEASPFAVLATTGPGGLDASPRGDAPGFVQVIDERTLLLPERRGNNRIDSLRNVLADPRVGLLFLVPGVDETLRVNGRARITVDPAVLGRCAVQGARPKCALWIEVDEVFFQCGRALIRSSLWAPRAADAPRPVPTAGQMLAALTEGTVGGADYDAALPQRQRATLYAD